MLKVSASVWNTSLPNCELRRECHIKLTSVKRIAITANHTNIVKINEAVANAKTKTIGICSVPADTRAIALVWSGRTLMLKYPSSKSFTHIIAPFAICFMMYTISLNCIYSTVHHSG